jgi:hypothetical protein
MKVKDLIEQLSTMNPEVDVFLAIYEPGDSGDQNHYQADIAVEYDDPAAPHVQIKGW